MNARELSERMSVSEFLDFCSWLDIEYGKRAKRFEVLDIKRQSRGGGIASVRVMLIDGSIITVTPDSVRRAAERLKRERSKDADCA